jgi:hypothetical protein
MGSQADDGGGNVASSLEASSWRACIQWRACVSSLVDMTVDVGAAAPSGGLVSQGGGLRDHVGQLFSWGGEVASMDWWQSRVASAARLSAQFTRLREGSVIFRPGRRPRMLVRRPWSTSSFSCAAWAVGS